MIDNSVKTKVRTNAEHQNAEISKNTGAIFSILTESVYSMPRLAGVREIIANALDSNRRAKSDEPIYVKAPSTTNHNFTVRDYGTGLSNEEIYSLYTSLGSSSKKDVEDEIGFFGIGALSPLAYVESFTVTSFQDGAQRMYIIFMSENGVPQITAVPEIVTKEPNGLEVSYAVPGQDISAFNEDIKSVLMFIEPSLYTVSSNLVPPKYFKAYLDSDKNSTALKFDNIWIRNMATVQPYWQRSTPPADVLSCRFFNRNTIVMGGVAYEYDRALIGEPILNSYYVVIEVPLGAVSIQASREKLKMNKKTIEYIKSVFKFIKDNIEAKVQKDVDQCTTYVQAFSIVSGFKLSNVQHLKWRGLTLSHATFLKALEEHFDIRYKYRKTFYPMTDYHARGASPTCTIILDDMTRGGRDRIKHSHQYDSLILLSAKSPELREAFEKTYGDIYSKKTSQLAALPNENLKAAPVKKKAKNVYFEFHPGGLGSTRANFVDATREIKIDIEKFDGYYILTSGRSFLTEKQEIMTLVHAKVISRVADKKVIIIDKSMEIPPNAKCLIKYIKTNIKALHERVHKSTQIRNVRSSTFGSNLLTLREDLKESYDKNYEDLKYCYDDLLAAVRVLGLAGQMVTNQTDYTEKFLKILHQHYPMFKFIDYRAFYAENKQHIESYLKTGDQNAFKFCFD